MSIPHIVHPWSLPPATDSLMTLASTPVLSEAPALDDIATVADALFAAGFVNAAIALSDQSDDAALTARASVWRDLMALDAAMTDRIMRGDGVLIPSVAVGADGTPRFMVRPTDSATAADLITREHGPNGVDPELRLFLDEALRTGDRYVDVAPGAGCAALSAASGAASTNVIVLCETATQADAITASAQVSGLAGHLTAYSDATLDQVAFAPTVAGASTILHLGSAANVAPMLRTVRDALERKQIGVVAWRCGANGGDGLDAEHLQVAAAVLGVFGFMHFALAEGEHGTELVPAEAMASNEMIFSVEPSFLARFAA